MYSHGPDNLRIDDRREGTQRRQKPGDIGRCFYIYSQYTLLQVNVYFKDEYKFRNANVFFHVTDYKHR